MEDVIQTYLLPYDPRYPVVCFDEACKQLFGEVRSPRRCRSGRTAQVDYEYERKGVRHQLMMCEPLRGWRHVKVTETAPGGTTPAVSGSWSRCTTPGRRRSCWSRTT